MFNVFFFRRGLRDANEDSEFGSVVARMNEMRVFMKMREEPYLIVKHVMRASESRDRESPAFAWYSPIDLIGIMVVAGSWGEFAGLQVDAYVRA